MTTPTTASKSGPAAPSRIAAAFARARAERRKALVLYLTGSLPDFETSKRLLIAAARAGVDVIELGIPWSDPSADGPAIQAAMRRALAAGGGMRASLALCRAVRDVDPRVAVVLFGYANPIFVRGPQAFAAAAAEAGADAVLCVDWPPDEASDLTAALRTRQIDYIPLLAPTSTPQRVRAVSAEAGGFIYYVSLTGTTGRALADFEGPRRHVAEIRILTGDRLPIAVGFGISTPDQARTVAGFADGVVVGTAAVRIIEQAVSAGRDPVPPLEDFVASLRAALSGLG
jgi:tryptophan synthase alpha chain